MYVSIGCPYCKTEFAEIPEDNVKCKKAGACLDHLRGDPEATPPVKPCQAALDAGVSTAERRARTALVCDDVTTAEDPSSVVKSTVINTDNSGVTHAMKSTEMQTEPPPLSSAQRSERHLAAIRDAFGISDHSSDDEEKIVQRTKRKLDDMVLEAYKRVAKAGRLSLVDEEATPVAIGRRVVDEVASVTKRADDATSHFDAVTHALGLDTCAGPEEQVEIVRDLACVDARWTSLAEGISTESSLCQFFNDSQVTRTGGQRLQIVSACKVVNSKQLSHFDASSGVHFSHTDAFRAADGSNDAFLFHGCPAESVPGIQASGILIRHASDGKLGVGVYGAPDPLMSLTYAKDDGFGQFMFVCRFNLKRAEHLGPRKYKFDEYCVYKRTECVVLWMLKVKCRGMA